MAPDAPKPSRVKRLLQNLALSLGTFLLCAAIFEAVLRFAGYGNLEIYEPDEDLYWRLKPNQQCFTKVDHKPVVINSRGTRGAEFEVPKPAGVFRVLCLGDSRTFGWGVSEAETYCGQLQRLLQDRLGRKVEVINAGVNAWSYSQMLVFFRKTGLQFQPDAVVIGEANLWTQFSEKNSPEFRKKFMSRVRLKNLLRRSAIYHYVVEVKLKSYYERHRSKFIPVDPKSDTLFKDQQQADFEKVFKEALTGLCDAALQNRVKPVLLWLPSLDELGATNAPSVLETKRELSRTRGVVLAEPIPTGLPDPKALYLPDDPVHFNTRGNEIIAARVAESVTSPAAP